MTKNDSKKQKPDPNRSGEGLDSPIFVVGYMHSGTTLLLEIIGRHSKVFSCRGESRFFEFLPLIIRSYPNLQDDTTLRRYLSFILKLIQNGFVASTYEMRIENTQEESSVERDELFTLVKNQRKHDVVFRIAVEFLALKAGKKRWLEKSPTHVFHLDRIFDSIPDARVVELVRDPRDVIASKKTRRQTVWSDRYHPSKRAKKHLEKAFDPMWDSLAWKSAIRAGEEARAYHNRQILSLRYEDLVSKPEQIIADVCEFIDVSFEPDMLDVRTRNSADTSRVESGVTADSVGRWTGVLSGSEIAMCQRVTKSEMVDLRYDLSPVGIRATLGMVGLVFVSFFEVWIRVFRKWRLGGTSFIITTLRNYLGRLKKLKPGR